MEIGPQKEDLPQHHTSIPYTPAQNNDHTLACVRADVYELSVATNDVPAKWYLKCSSEPVSLCYDAYRLMYRALCLKGNEIIVNSCIMPDSKISKTAPLFCTWNDDRTKKHIGFGFKKEVLIDTFIKAFEEAKKNMAELMGHIVPVNTKHYQNYSESDSWQQPILLNYNVAVQHQPQMHSDSLLTSLDGSMKTSTAKSNNTTSISSRRVTAIKTASGPGSFDMRTGKTPEYERRSQQLSAHKGPDVLALAVTKENMQLKQFLAANNVKTKELKREIETLKRRNNTMHKSNEVLVNNTNSLQTKCEEAEKKRQYWKDFAEKSEIQQKVKLEESEKKQRYHLAEILEQRDRVKNESEQQQMETRDLRIQEQTLYTMTQDLQVENKSVTVAERRIQEDRILIKRLTEEQLKDSVELKNKIENTVKTLTETSVAIKNSIQKTAFIIERSNGTK